MRRWLAELANTGNTERPHPGLGFDLLDEIVTGVLHFRPPDESGFSLTSEMVPYQPTPARHVLDLIATCKLSSSDTLIDLGSGLGQVPLLVSILTGIRTLGVEIQPDYVASAQQAAQNLNLLHARFVAEDARATDLSSGTVFFLFSPFSGSILTDLLRRLHGQSQKRQIRIATLGPCTRVVQSQPWLTANKQPDPEQITVFRSHGVGYPKSHLRF